MFLFILAFVFSSSPASDFSGKVVWPCVTCWLLNCFWAITWQLSRAYGFFFSPYFSLSFSSYTLKRSNFILSSERKLKVVGCFIFGICPYARKHRCWDASLLKIYVLLCHRNFPHGSHTHKRYYSAYMEWVFIFLTKLIFFVRNMFIYSKLLRTHQFFLLFISSQSLCKRFMLGCMKNIKNHLRIIPKSNFSVHCTIHNTQYMLLWTLFPFMIKNNTFHVRTYTTLLHFLSFISI